jgi:tetratricopeptide (TPR) repeat protein
MGKRLRQAPHTGQSNNNKSLANIEERKQAIVARIDDATPRADTRLYERAIEKFPEDNLLHARFAQYLEAMSRRDRAIAQFRKVSELLPDLALPKFYVGNLLMRAGRNGEAEQAFKEALKIRPDCREALAGLAELRD